jgi:hypothetical protein
MRCLLFLQENIAMKTLSGILLFSLVYCQIFGQKLTHNRLTPLSKDSLDISTIHSDKLIESKKYLHDILERHPELKPNEFMFSPGYLYDHQGDPNFNCEACRDDYFQLYAYFLKPFNKGNLYQNKRENLVKIFRDILLINGKLNNGSIGHQYNRAVGYAEYDIYLYLHYKDDYRKMYDITKQKALYLALLKQRITDEVNNNPEYSPNEKIKNKALLFKGLKDLTRLITNYFYLKMAQAYEYENI